MAVETRRPGTLAVWYREIREFKGSPPLRRPFPHLTMGALLVTILVGSYFVVEIADAVAIILGYGTHAFFVENLRITDWKHDGLSNGAHLSFLAKLIQVPTTLVLMALLVYGADFVAMLLRVLIGHSPRWIEALLHVLGGTGLLLFARGAYKQMSHPLHPVPLSALVGGAVLIWRAIAWAIRGNPPEPQT